MRLLPLCLVLLEYKYNGQSYKLADSQQRLWKTNKILWSIMILFSENLSRKCVFFIWQYLNLDWKQNVSQFSPQNKKNEWRRYAKLPWNGESTQWMLIWTLIHSRTDFPFTAESHIYRVNYIMHDGYSSWHRILNRIVASQFPPL